MELNDKLKILGYDKRWLEYGFLTEQELNKQFNDYSIAKNNPESKEADYYGYQHTEHLRYGQFWKISEENKKFTDEQIEKLIELVESDEDEIMSMNFYRDILNKKRVTLSQIEKYDELKL